MRATKVVITLDRKKLCEVDRCVKEGRFPSRRQAILAALSEMLEGQRRLLDGLAKLNVKQERALAEEFLSGEPAFSQNWGKTHNLNSGS